MKINSKIRKGLIGLVLGVSITSINCSNNYKFDDSLVDDSLEKQWSDERFQSYLRFEKYISIDQNNMSPEEAEFIQNWNKNKVEIEKKYLPSLRN